VTFTDAAGNSTVSNITVNNIDKTPPVLLAPQYSTLIPTNGSVVVTISSAENLGAPAGWVKSSSNPWLYTKTYAANANQIITFTDAAGNTTDVTVIVANIDTV
jgi:hypothetical protein